MHKNAFPTEALTLTLTDMWATGVVHCHACKTVTKTFSTETTPATETDGWGQGPSQQPRGHGLVKPDEGVPPSPERDQRRHGERRRHRFTVR